MVFGTAFGDLPKKPQHRRAPCALSEQPGTRTLNNEGDVKNAFAKADHVLERYFETPYLVAIPMATMNAVASVHDGKIDVWAGLPTPIPPFADIILEMGLAEHPDALVIHQPYVGGQFGRQNDWDFVLYAIYGAKIDALAYRKSLIKDARLMTTLDDVAERAQWGKKLPAGSAGFHHDADFNVGDRRLT